MPKQFESRDCVNGLKVVFQRAVLRTLLDTVFIWQERARQAPGRSPCSALHLFRHMDG